MGAGCSKACTSSHTGWGAMATTSKSKNAQTSIEDIENPFSISIDCYCVPSARILSHPTALLGPGAGCRSVVVTTIRIEKFEQRNHHKRASKLNSAIYTPVIHWFGVDVKQQVPQYLPMNMWPGTYTVFGFYNPEDSGSTCVKLTAKVGSQEISLQEQMDTERCLSNEKWSSIARLMTKELKKLDTPVKRASYMQQQEKVDAADIDEVNEEKMKQRDSQDTGYMSTKRSMDHSPYSMKYIACASDGEDTTSLKRQQSSEMKLKLRRKDTPVHGLHPARLSPHSLDFRDNILQEESETFTATGIDITTDEPCEIIRPTSALGKYTLQTLDTSNQFQLSAQMTSTISKSTSDLRGTEYTSLETVRSNSYDGGDRKIRKKKRSIISKLGVPSSKAEFGENKELHDRDSDKGADADDEDDISFAENVCLSRDDSYHNITIEDENPKLVRVQSEENDEKSVIAVGLGECKTDLTNPGTNISPETSEMPRFTKDDRESVDERTMKSRTSMTSGANQELFCKEENERNLDADPDHCENATNACLVVHEETGGKQNEIITDESSKTEEMGIDEKKDFNEFDVKDTRPRSRTLSKKNIYDDRHFKQRYSRTSKSVSIPSRNYIRGNKKKSPTIPTQPLDKAQTKMEEPPLTPKEAFSDS